MFVAQACVFLFLFTILQCSSSTGTSESHAGELFDEAPEKFGELDKPELNQEDATPALRNSKAKRQCRYGWFCKRVSIKLDWDSCVHKTKPPIFTTRVWRGTRLARILEMAADQYKCYRFHTQYFPKPLGHFVTSICNIAQNKELNYFWLIYERPGKLTPTGIDNFVPKDGSVTTFRYQFVKSHSG